VQHIDGEYFESGASIAVEANPYLIEMSEYAELARIPQRGGDRNFGLWNGEEMVFSTSNNGFLANLQLLWRYKYDLIKLTQGVSAMLKKWMELYTVQEEGRAFETPQALFESVGLWPLTQETMTRELGRVLRRAPGERSLLEKELVTAVNRVNYNQPNTLNALAGMVSLTPMVKEGVWQIRDGNYQIAERVLEKTGAVVHLNSTVVRVDAAPEDHPQGYKFLLTLARPAARAAGDAGTGTGSASGMTQPEDDPFPLGFDFVVLATPLALSARNGRALRLPPTAQELVDSHLKPQEADYQTTVSTFVRGCVRAEAFGLHRQRHAGDASCPVQVAEVFNVDAAAPASFSSVSEEDKMFPASGASKATRLYKVFSTAPLQPELLDWMFENDTSAGWGWEVMASDAWRAYPKLHPHDHAYAPFQLQDGLFYVNAIENAASAMEVLAVGARNVAMLMAERARGEDATWRSKPPSLEPESVWRWRNASMPRAYYLDVPWKTVSAAEMLELTGFRMVWLGAHPAAWEAPLKQLQADHGFVEADEILLDWARSPLEAAAALGWGGKFSREHAHGEDEVRFVTEGAVMWDVRAGPTDRWIRVHVYQGEAAVIPKRAWHRMMLHHDPPLARIVRVYKDSLGWQAVYRDEIPQVGCTDCNLKKEL